MILLRPGVVGVGLVEVAHRLSLGELYRVANHHLPWLTDLWLLETLARVGGSRWRIETEFETEKSDVGLDEYETRSWRGGIIILPCACWRGPSC